MNTLSTNCEWDFVTNRMTSYKNRYQKKEILFKLQILLSILGKSQNLEEKRMLTLIYQKQKEKYIKL